MADGAHIEKNDFNVVSRYLFCFISKNIMPSQNKSILHHPKVVLVGMIID